MTQGESCYSEVMRRGLEMWNGAKQNWNPLRQAWDPVVRCLTNKKYERQHCTVSKVLASLIHESRQSETHRESPICGICSPCASFHSRLPMSLESFPGSDCFSGNFLGVSTQGLASTHSFMHTSSYTFQLLKYTLSATIFTEEFVLFLNKGNTRQFSLPSPNKLYFFGQS